MQIAPWCPHPNTARLGWSTFSLVAMLAACEPGSQTEENPPAQTPLPIPIANPDSVAGVICTPHAALRRIYPTDERLITTQFGARARVPEYNDCQRLAIVQADRTLKYGPLAIILAFSDILDTLTLARVAAVPADKGALVAMVIVDTTVNTMVYPSLHLRTGISCAYLARTGPGNQLGVLIAPQNASQICDPAGAPSITGQLTVQRTHVDADATNIPSTARWDEGTVASGGGPPVEQPSFGFRCEDGWCEAGPAGLLPSPAHEPGSPKKQRRIKGWYDQQVLAELDGAGRPVRGPGNVKSAIIPHEDLETYTLNSFDNTWTEVATIEMGATTLKYQTMYGFQPGINRLQLRYISGTQKWEGRVFGAFGGAPTSVKVTMAHWHAQGFIAAARWGWFDDDETMWVRCALGCCQVSDD